MFKAPAGLANRFVDFFKVQRAYALPSLSGMIRTLERYHGAYALYYHGDHQLYGCVSDANRDGCRLPIYVGKSSPKGSRTGVEDVEETASGGKLYGRLSIHKRSTNQAANLRTEDFSFRFAATEENLSVWGEGVLIRHFHPVWNQLIPGFGINQPGEGRGLQVRSVWDRLHPGRTVARDLPDPGPVDEERLGTEIAALCNRTLRVLDHG